MEQLRIFAKYRFLLKNLISRDIKVKYRRSTLGLAWSVLNPLMMMGVQFVVFSNLFRNDIPHFAVYLISGNLMFSFFSEGTQSAMTSMLGAAPLIKKVYVPKYIFPLEKVLFSLVNTLFSCIALVVVIIIDGSPITWNILYAPIPIILLMIFNTGVGLVLATGVVFFRDITHLYSVLIVALTYFTPLFYDERMLIEKAPMVFKALHYNPIYWYVTMFREIVLYGRPPSVMQCILCSIGAVVALIIGLLVFRKAQDKFILYV